MNELPQANELSYWKTGRTAPDEWIDKARRLVEQWGGEWLGDAFGNDSARGVGAYLVTFRFGEDTFRIVWPVLPHEDGEALAARRQAATSVYHDVKDRGHRFRIFGATAAFFEHKVLPDGRRVADLAAIEATELPRMLGIGRAED